MNAHKQIQNMGDRMDMLYRRQMGILSGKITIFHGDFMEFNGTQWGYSGNRMNI